MKRGIDFILNFLNKPTLIAIILFAVINFIAAVFLMNSMFLGILIGYFLGLLAVTLQFITSTVILNAQGNSFFVFLFSTLFIRFLLVLSIFVLILLTTKIDSLGFTVSFIISYIYHSVIEIILINKKLTNRSS